MNNADLFRKQMNELQQGEIEYSEAYFLRTYGDKDLSEETSAAIIRETSSKLPSTNIAPTFGAQHIDDTWLENQEGAEQYDGELAVDVFHTNKEVVITSTVAGVTAEDLDIDLNGDMITIRGIRKPAFSHVNEDDFLVRECYWGGFSRTIILPVDIQYDSVKATLENGILTVILPKSQQTRNGKIVVEER